MGASGSLMAVAFGAQAASTAAGAYSQSQAQKAQGKFQKQQLEQNAKFSEMAANETTSRAEADVRRLQRQEKKVIGDQRATLAAQGIDVDDGSAAEAQEEVRLATAQDIQTVRNNAWREAYGLRSGAIDYRSRGAMADITGRSSSRATLLTGSLDTTAYGFRAYAATK